MTGCEHCGDERAYWIAPETLKRIRCVHEFLCDDCLLEQLDLADQDDEEGRDLIMMGYVDEGPKT